MFPKKQKPIYGNFLAVKCSSRPYVFRCEIYHLYNLKNGKYTHGGVSLSVKLRLDKEHMNNGNFVKRVKILQ